MQTTEYNISVPSDNEFKLMQGASSTSLKVYVNKHYVYVYVNITGSLSTLNTWGDTGLVINDEQYRPKNTISNVPSNQRSNISVRINAADGKIQYQNGGQALSSDATTLVIFFYPRRSTLP